MQNQYGLYVNEIGEIYLAGNKFYGMGLNFFDGFSRTSLPYPDNNYEDSIKKISQNGIPFIRMMFGNYYAKSIREYIDNPEEYFRRLDLFVKCAEHYRVGIIASLFWWICGFPDLAGESVNHIGKPNSKTVSLAKQYVHDVVTRYNDSPAIWGWEIGNEYNLEADLGGVFKENTYPVGKDLGAPEFRTSEDFVSSDDISAFYSEISSEIRKYDNHRIIINGDADYRPSQYHLRTEKSWVIDSQDELLKIMKIFAPQFIDTVSVHIYELEQERWGRKTNIEELLEVYANHAKSMKKALYLGEFGATESEELMKRQFSAIRKSNIQLSSPWNYNMIGLTHGSFSDNGHGSHVFWGTAEINKQYRMEGLQKTEDYWAS